MKINAGAVVFGLLLVVGGGAGAYVLNRNAEALVDRIADQEIRASGMALYLPPDNLPGSERLARLKQIYGELYDGPRARMSYNALVALWQRQIPGLKDRAWLPSQPVDERRLDAEIDERFGAGASAFMAQERQRDVEAQAAMRAEVNARIEEYERRTQETTRAIEEYVQRTGHMPPPGSRVENGKVVTP